MTFCLVEGVTSSLQESFLTTWNFPSQPIHMNDNNQTVTKKSDDGISVPTVAAGTAGGIVSLTIFLLFCLCYKRRKTSNRDLKGEQTSSKCN